MSLYKFVEIAEHPSFLCTQISIPLLTCKETLLKAQYLPIFPRLEAPNGPR